ncbi:glutamate receptor-like [Argiope bruennichi]|uniref:glutamate receptor-like n=1 Tax=Argiope bruennichi TaxID=94029 RepID=UPI0024947F31|nr:glutamate receptor-like [Argiope bruennichi]
MIFPNSLKISTVQITDLLGLVKTPTNTGLFAFEEKLLTCLAKSLQFEFDVFLQADGQWGSLVNGSWSGVIGTVERGEADMGIAYMAITEERSHAVDFSFPYAIMERTFLVKEPGPIPHLMGYFYPFSKRVWILYILLIFASAFIFQKVIFKNVSFLVSFIAILGSVLTQSIEVVPRLSDWKRVILGLWLTIAAVMPFLYMVSFLSFVTMPGKMPGIRDFRDLSKAVLNKNYRCLSLKGTADVDLLLKSEMDYLKMLGETIRQHNWKYEMNEDLNYLVDDTTALIMSRQMTQLVLGGNTDSDIQVSEDSFGIWHVAIAIRKGFCCKQQVDIQIIRILRAGLYKKWFDDQQVVGY